MLGWLVGAGEPSKSNVGADIKLLWSEAGVEGLDEVTLSFHSHVWLGDSGPLLDDDVLAEVGSGSVSVSENHISHLGVSDGLSSLVEEPKFSPLLVDVGELDNESSSFLLLGNISVEVLLLGRGNSEEKRLSTSTGSSS